MQDRSDSADPAAPGELEYFVYGPQRQCEALRRALPEGLVGEPIAGGLRFAPPVRLTPAQIEAMDRRIAALAEAHGLEYDGWGAPLERAADLSEAERPLEVLFSRRTGLTPGAAFAFPLAEALYGHAIFLGEAKTGAVLLDILRLTAAAPASAAQAATAPRLYRQPILVHNTAFTALPAPGAAESRAAVPREIRFRIRAGWPEPAVIETLLGRYGLDGPLGDESWRALLARMSAQGARMPGCDQYSLMVAKIGKTGAIRQVEEPGLLPLIDPARAPMPWGPWRMSAVRAALAGGPDEIAMSDLVL